MTVAPTNFVSVDGSRPGSGASTDDRAFPASGDRAGARASRRGSSHGYFIPVFLPERATVTTITSLRGRSWQGERQSHEHQQNGQNLFHDLPPHRINTIGDSARTAAIHLVAFVAFLVPAQEAIPICLLVSAPVAKNREEAGTAFPVKVRSLRIIVLSPARIVFAGVQTIPVAPLVSVRAISIAAIIRGLVEAREIDVLDPTAISIVSPIPVPIAATMALPISIPIAISISVSGPTLRAITTAPGVVISGAISTGTTAVAATPITTVADTARTTSTAITDAAASTTTTAAATTAAAAAPTAAATTAPAAATATTTPAAATATTTPATATAATAAAAAAISTAPTLRPRG